MSIRSNNWRLYFSTICLRCRFVSHTTWPRRKSKNRMNRHRETAERHELILKKSPETLMLLLEKLSMKRNVKNQPLNLTNPLENPWFIKLTNSQRFRSRCEIPTRFQMKSIFNFCGKHNVGMTEPRTLMSPRTFGTHGRAADRIKDQMRSRVH
nr:hypothetical transcript [Hymenolepis microstoma]